MAERAVLAAAQFASPAGRLAENTEQAVAAVDEAGDRGAHLVVLPEFCLSGYDGAWIREGAPGGGVQEDAPEVAALVEHAARRQVAVVFNDLTRDGDRLFSTSFVVAEGTVLGRHRKTILTPGETANGLTPGDLAAPVVTVPGLPVPVGPMICFEHGFPEIALHLALGGAGVLAISSAITAGTEYLRNLRTRARAQDNGCYVVASSAIGEGYCGESMIVDPRGEVLVRASASEPEVVTAELDPALIAEQRRREPVLALRRPELHALTQTH